MAGKKCKDCGAGKRPAPFPGPRCATHHREKVTQDKRAAWERRILQTYGITGEQYDELLKAQGGTCFICRRANGASRKLAVDHDHKSGYVRGLLCRPCNNLLGHLRDDPDAAHRVFWYLYEPPAFEVIGKVKPDAA